MSNGYCRRCGHHTTSWGHRNECLHEYAASPVHYVKCVVPHCFGLVNEDALTADGMCPPHLWDLAHDAFWKARRVSA